MPDQRRHRGPHPSDAELFAPAQVPALQAATSDLSWLLGRDYATPSAIKLVGDRYNLTERQRTAVMRSACAPAAGQARLQRRLEPSQLAGQRLWVDGYNLLTTIEAALAGGVVLSCQDECYRDLASIHGTWRRVEETPVALGLIADVLREFGVAGCEWYLDSPVSNSGRLKGIILEAAERLECDWSVELVMNPDPLLSAATGIVVTADSVILDRCGPWANLAREVVSRRVTGAWVVEMGQRVH